MGHVQKSPGLNKSNSTYQMNFNINIMPFEIGSPALILF